MSKFVESEVIPHIKQVQKSSPRKGCEKNDGNAHNYVLFNLWWHPLKSDRYVKMDATRCFCLDCGKPKRKQTTGEIMGDIVNTAEGYKLVEFSKGNRFIKKLQKMPWKED